MKNLIYSILIIIALVLSCKGKSEISETPVPKETNKIILNAEEFKNAELISGFAIDSMVSIEKELNGIIDVPPQNNVCISFPMGGFLKYTALIPGMTIKKGQSIAIMEDQAFIQLQQDYLISASQLELKEAEYLRQKDLNISKASSDKAYQLAKSDYETARITKKALSEKLEILGIDPDKLTFDNISKNVVIHSPVNGIVSKVHVNVGKFINPSDIMFEIIDGSDIHLKLTAFENDVNSFQIGNEVAAYTNFENGEQYKAKIISISPSLNETSRSFDIHCHFLDKNIDLIPGMYMNAKVSGGKSAKLILPENAVVSYGKNDFIFTDLNNKTYEMTEVEITYKANGLIGVSPDKYGYLKTQKVVIENAHFLLMKLKNAGD